MRWENIARNASRGVFGRFRNARNASRATASHGMLLTAFSGDSASHGVLLAPRHRTECFSCHDCTARNASRGKPSGEEMGRPPVDVTRSTPCVGKTSHGVPLAAFGGDSASHGVLLAPRHRTECLLRLGAGQAIGVLLPVFPGGGALFGESVGAFLCVLGLLDVHIRGHSRIPSGVALLQPAVVDGLVDGALR